MSLDHKLYTIDDVFYKTITNYVSGYRHEHTAFGPSSATFTISEDIDLMDEVHGAGLMMIFRTFDEGVKVWEGFVWDMTLDLHGVKRTVSMDKVRNRVKVSATDPDNGSIKHYTHWVNDTESQALYGVLEHVESMSTAADIVLVDGAPARISLVSQYDGSSILVWEHDKKAEWILDNYAYPSKAYQGSSDPSAGLSLEVTCVGRSFVANKVVLSDGWITDEDDEAADGTNLRDCGDLTFLVESLVAGENISHGDGGSGTTREGYWTISHEIKRIVGVIQEQSGVLFAIDIDQRNDTYTAAGVSQITGAIDRLKELVNIPDISGNEYEMFVRQNGGVLYRRKQTVHHSVLLNDGWKERDLKTPVSWRAHVAPIKIIDPTSIGLPGVRTITPGRVSVSDGVATFGPEETTEEDIERAISVNIKWIEEVNKDA